MTSKEFFYLVCEMRRAQRNYFKGRGRREFLAAVALENDVDREIKRVKDILGEEND